MVSFQCNDCGDILTKPKLDKHRVICHASFDCIDCGKRFETPADYKGHTSCISEAEKYQKGLYNGGSGPERNGGSQRWRQQGGGRQRGDNRQRWQQRNMNQATGANGTPLGTPARMSPINDTPVGEVDSKKMQPTAEATRKRKAEAEITGLEDTPKPTKKQKTVEDTRETTEAKVVKSRTKGRSTPEAMIPKKAPRDNNFQHAEDRNTPQEVGEMKEKKKKKKKKKSETKEPKEDEKMVKKEKKRRKKEGPSPSGEELGISAILDAEATIAAQPPTTEVPSKINPEKARSTKKSKSKSKSKLQALATNETPDVIASDTPRSTVEEVAGVARNGPERNRGKKGHSGDHRADNGDAKQVALGNSETNLKKKSKEKKKKRKSEGQTASVVE